jgi:hypothetical protein
MRNRRGGRRPHQGGRRPEGRPERRAESSGGE